MKQIVEVMQNYSKIIKRFGDSEKIKGNFTCRIEDEFYKLEHVIGVIYNRPVKIIEIDTSDYSSYYKITFGFTDKEHIENLENELNELKKKTLNY